MSDERGQDGRPGRGSGRDPTVWEIDPRHSTVEFALRHMVFATVKMLDRKAFGLRWNAPLEAGGVLVGEEVAVEIHVEAVRKP